MMHLEVLGESTFDPAARRRVVGDAPRHGERIRFRFVLATESGEIACTYADQDVAGLHLVGRIARISDDHRERARRRGRRVDDDDLGDPRSLIRSTV